MSQQRAIRQCGCLPCQQQPGSEVAGEHAAINRVVATLDERRRRLVVGCLAAQWGRGGITRLAQITGLSRNTIVRGRRALPRLLGCEGLQDWPHHFPRRANLH